MESRGNKYISILWRVGLLALGFIVAMTLIFFALRLTMGVLNQFSWFSLLFVVLTILVPFVVFQTAYGIFWKRTGKHPVGWVRAVSYTVFAAAMLMWIVVTCADVIRFFKYHYDSIDKYWSFNLWVLAGSVFGLFMIGLIQAATTPKQEDWLKKHEG